jgi:hypothetical protein
MGHPGVDNKTFLFVGQNKPIIWFAGIMVFLVLPIIFEAIRLFVY